MALIKRILFSIFLIVIFVGIFAGGFYYGENLTVCEICPPTDFDFSLFWTAYNQLQEKFVNPEKIDLQKILYGAITGMAESLGDPYTTFFNPTEAEQFQDELSGFFNGIGVEMGVQREVLTIISPLKGTPAEAVGLRAGDKITKINSKDTFEMTTDEAITLIRGEKGTEVTLTIYRSGWTEEKDFVIVRDTIKIPSLDWKIVNGDIAHIEIYQFSQSLATDFNKAALEILNSPAKKVILDLRNNPGGYLEIAQDVAGWFLEKNKVVVIEDFGAGKDQKTYETYGNGNFSQYPMVILINQGSASASEILAGALKDNRNIQLIGEKSFGKGSVQEGVVLEDGSFLKVTIAKWLTPNGISISEKGLEPDIKVGLTEQDYEQDKDPQLDKAIEIIEGMQ